MKSRVFPQSGSYLFYNLARVGIVVVLLIAVQGIVPQQPADGDCSLREAIYAANNNVGRDGGGHI
jgi:hypothetical protein